jgi:MFS family permease
MTHLPLPQAKRAAILLAVASAIGGSAGPIAIGTGGLVGASLLPPGQIALATVPVSAFVLGPALASIPAAMTMRRIGRRNGFIIGAGIGAIGAAITTAGIVMGAFWVFCLGMVFLGAASAFAQQYRFAAADASEPAFRPRAISWVLAGGVVTGVIGPQLAIHAQPLIPGAPLAGPFLTLVGLLVVTGFVLARLDVPPPPPIVKVQAGRPLLGILMQPKFLVALLAAISSYALMSLVMTATPLAMLEHHHSHADAQTGIQWHVIAMFGPSFFTGALIARFGVDAIVATGMALLFACAVVALSGIDLAHFWIALILLGLGWNFGFIGATTMLLETYRPEEKNKVQGLNDFLVFGSVALASLSSGKLFTSVGWEWINYAMFPVIGVCLLALALGAIGRRRSVL